MYNLTKDKMYDLTNDKIIYELTNGKKYKLTNDVAPRCTTLRVTRSTMLRQKVQSPELDKKLMKSDFDDNITFIIVLSTFD